MRIVFFGTPDYVLPILNGLDKHPRTKSPRFLKAGASPIVAVVTQPPKPVGRGKILTYSAIDTWAHKRKIPVYYRADDLVKEGVQADLGILAAYGEIIPSYAINHFSHGILNVHPSLLPAWRGASPVQATLVAGDRQTGVTIIKLDEKLDHGPIISQFTEGVLADDTTGTLRQRLFEKSVDVLATLIPPYLQGKITPRKQNDKSATFTTLIKKNDGFIPPKHFTAALANRTANQKWPIGFMPNFSLLPTPTSLERFIRAMQPWPISWTNVMLSSKKNPKRLKILNAHLESEKLVLDEVQLEGKNPVPWKQFNQGYPTTMFE